MKKLFPIFLLPLFFFTACGPDPATPEEEGIPFLGDKLHFDNAFLSRGRSYPDGSFQTKVVLLQSPATYDLINDITGLPADAFVFYINSGNTPLTIPAGTYEVGSTRMPFQFVSQLIKNDLQPSYQGTFDAKSGTITVSINDDGSRLFSFDLQTVELENFFDEDAALRPLVGEISLPLVPLE